MANATARKRRLVENTLVSTATSVFSSDEVKKIDNMYVKLGKLGGHVRSGDKSDVWLYFGELFYR